MKPGTKPKSPEAKKLAGVKPCRIPNSPEIATAPALSNPPTYLDAVGVAKWNEIYPVLQGSGVLKVSDLGTLGSYCYAYSQFFIAQKCLAALGITEVEVINGNGEKGKKQLMHIIVTPNGMIQSAPYVTTARQWLEVMQKIAAELGMTPSSRGRLNVAPTDPKKDELLAFLTGKNGAPKD